MDDRKKNFRGHFLTESISPICLRHVQREGKTLGKTPEIVSRCQLRAPVDVGGRNKVAEENTTSDEEHACELASGCGVLRSKPAPSLMKTRAHILPMGLLA